MSKASIKFEDGKIVAGLDTNEDGENSVEVRLNLKEGFEEGFAALKKGEEKTISVDAKAVNFVFKDNSIFVVIDTDKDGEELMDVKIDISESFEEIAEGIFKKD